MTDIVAAGMVVQSDTVWPDRAPNIQPGMSPRANRIVQKCVEVIRERSIGKQSARVIIVGMYACSGSIWQYHEESRNRR